MTRSADGAITVLFVEDNEDGTVGGSHTCLFNLMTHLDRAVVRPIGLFYQDNRVAAQLRGKGFDIAVWESERAAERSVGPGPFRRFAQVAQLGRAITRRMRFLRDREIDLIHLNNSPGVGFDDWLIAARLLGVPCITSVRIYFPTLERWLWRRLQRRFDHYVPVSQTLLEFMAREEFPTDRCTVVYDTIDEADLRVRIRQSRDTVRAELGVAENQLLVVMAGHLRPWKGQDVVLSELARLAPEIRRRLRVVFAGGAGAGDEPYRARLDQLTRELSLADVVQFLGERTDVPDLMGASDIVLHASTIPEPFGLVVLEGMLLGKPVIAARAGGPTEIITPDTGLLFDPHTPGDLAAALEIGMDDATRAAVGAAGQVRARSLGTVANTARQIEDVYRRLPGLQRRPG